MKLRMLGILSMKDFYLVRLGPAGHQVFEAER